MLILDQARHFYSAANEKPCYTVFFIITKVLSTAETERWRIQNWVSYCCAWIISYISPIPISNKHLP